MSWITKTSTSALAAGAILLSAGCTSKKDVAIANKDEMIRRQESEIASAEADRARMAEQARQTAALNQQLAQQNTEVIERTAKLQTASMQAQQASNERLAALQTEVADLDGVIKSMPKTVVVNQPCPVAENQNGNVYKDREGSIHIQVAGSVLFDAGRADLRSNGSEALGHIVHTIRSHYPNNAIRIEGHTDSTPVVHARDRYPDNMALSQARAAAVYDFLGKHGLSNKMYTAGYGDRQPLISPEKCAGDRAKNRRVEIVILPNNLHVQKDTLAQNDSPRPYRTSSPAVVAASAPAKITAVVSAPPQK